MITPFVKSAGGKRNVLTATLQFFPPADSYSRYIEPFFGGGALFWHLKPKCAIISDLNNDLMLVYQAIREQPISLMEHLDHLTSRYGRDPKEFYLQIRKEFNIRSNDWIHQAASYIFLSKTSFNGLWRVNRKGEFNVPFGQRKTCPKLYDIGNVQAASAYLKSHDIQIKTQDFRAVLKQASNGDLCYIDPPYRHPGSFTTYNPNGFTQKDYEDMVELLVAAHSRGAKVVISNSLDDKELFAGFQQHVIHRNTSISGFTAARIRTPEYIYCLL